MIRRHKLQPVVAGDTAGAAREVANGRIRVARRLRRGWQVRSMVSTRWPRTSRMRATTRPVSSCCRGMSAGRRGAKGRSVTTFVFRVRNVPAALYKALGVRHRQRQHDKARKLMEGGGFTATQFLADVDGPQGPAPGGDHEAGAARDGDTTAWRRKSTQHASRPARCGTATTRYQTRAQTEASTQQLSRCRRPLPSPCQKRGRKRFRFALS